MKSGTMPGGVLILPHHGAPAGRQPCGYADQKTVARISDWLHAKTLGIRDVWTRQPGGSRRQAAPDSQTSVERLIRVLLHHSFNHQSRGRYESILPDIRRTIAARVATGRRISFFLLYNGGYRASPFPGNPALIFHPDQTELMLLHQISRLQERVTELHGPGIDFAIVINNGVALWANDIPVAETEAYVARLREMMRAVGADRGVRLLVQSELAGFREGLGGLRCPPASSVSRKEHAVVERFLGRKCNEEEARRRIALYALAEAAWAERLRPIAASEGAILLRQVAHPAMLSFRPFPGGAIRAQNGSLGFFAHEHALLPKLITTESFACHAIELANITRASMTGRGAGISPERVDA